MELIHSEYAYVNSTNEQEDEKVQPPVGGMIYTNIDDIVTVLQKYECLKGFEFVKFRNTKDEEGEPKYQVFACNRAGTRKPRNKKNERKRTEARFDCPIRVTASKASNGCWNIVNVKLDHNHEISASKSRFITQHRNLTPYVKRRLDCLDLTGVKTSKSIQAIRAEEGGPESMSCLPKDCRNYVERFMRLRLIEGDVDAIHRLFLRMQKVSRNFFFDIDADKEGRMRNVFWVDARSIAAYKEFSDVLTFDATYMLNKYKMSFAPFVGVNYHVDSILLRCALLNNEDIKTYEWLFSTWLRAMGGKCPIATIIDQRKCIGTGIDNIFSGVRHRWCICHILMKFPKKVGGHSRYIDLYKSFIRVIYNTYFGDEFEHEWKIMVRDFKLKENEWFTALNDGRKKWVSIFVTDVFWARMSSTQRSVSVNAFFDGYVHSKTTLKTFVEYYEVALGDKIEKKISADAECLVCVVSATN